jgi:transcriptional regulator with XRE-family HTH domain
MRRSIHSTPYVVLREHLASARIAAALTQEELAAKLERPQSYIAKYETGDRRLDVVEFLEVCASIGIEPASVLDAVQEAFDRG